MIESLLYLIIWLGILAVVYWLGTLVIGALPSPSTDPIKPVLRIILLVVIVLCAIYMLVGFLPAPLHGFPHRP